MADGKDGIWLEVSKVRIARKKVEIQVAGDKASGSNPTWWRVKKKALAEKHGQPTFNAIAKGLDSASDQTVIAKLGAKAKKKLDLVCKSIRIQTK